MYVFFQLFNESPRGFKFFAVIHFNFQSTKEVLHYAIVHTVSFAGHTLCNVVLRKKPLVFGVLVLPTLIRVKQWSCFGRKFLKRLVCMKISFQQIVCYFANFTFAGMVFAIFALFSTQMKGFHQFQHGFVVNWITFGSSLGGLSQYFLFSLPVLPIKICTSKSV